MNETCRTMTERKHRTIVVMGGSFNPPTLAHGILMKTALDVLGSDLGFFVPVSDAYLKRKMLRTDTFMVLPPEVRVAMLETMCTDERMRVYGKEIGTVMARTVDTLTDIKNAYPDADVYFIMGDDKLKLLLHMIESDDFLDRFGVVLYSREYAQARLMEIFDSIDLVRKNMGRVVIIPQPEGMESISSTLVRERMFAGISSEDMLSPGVWEIFRSYGPDDFPKVISRFSGDHAFLSNAFGCRLEWKGVTFGSAADAFRSADCDEYSRLETMESILRAKFTCNPDLLNRLMETGEKLLINGNNRKETYWGIDLYSWRGENNLGKLLMKIRRN